MHRVHEPVPLYAREIQRPVDGFMSRLQPDKPFTRANWTVRAHGKLSQCMQHLCTDWTPECRVSRPVLTLTAAAQQSAKCGRFSILPVCYR